MRYQISPSPCGRGLGEGIAAIGTAPPLTPSRKGRGVITQTPPLTSPLRSAPLTARRRHLAKYKIATPTGASFTVAGGGYDLEMEPLEGIDCEIVEGPTDEDGFIKFARTPMPSTRKGIRISKKIIDGLPERVSRHHPRQRRRRQRRCEGRHRARHPGDQLPRYVHRGSRRPRDDAAAVDASAAPSSRIGWCAKASGAKAARRCCRSRA